MRKAHASRRHHDRVRSDPRILPCGTVIAEHAMQILDAIQPRLDHGQLGEAKALLDAARRLIESMEQRK